jgi:prophage maintenance system killer protein
LFLLLNGKKLTATQADATLAVLGIAASEISE